MIGYKTLAIPGPTNMPHEVQRAMQIPLEDHRAPDIPEFTKPLFSDLKDIFRTKTGEVFVFPGSGTGGWEAAISNLLTAGFLCSHTYTSSLLYYIIITMATCEFITITALLE